MPERRDAFDWVRQCTATTTIHACVIMRSTPFRDSGQTGSGKTYTMFGTETAQFKDTQSSVYIRSKFRNFNRERGVVIRACEDVFECIAHRRMAAGKQGTLPVVFVCECVRVICPPLKSTDRRAHMFGLYNATSVCAVHDDGVSSVRVIALPSVIHDIWRRCGIMHVHQRPVCRCHVCLIQCNGMRHAPGARCVFCVCTCLLYTSPSPRDRG